jgi:hypothetical protein
MGHMGDARNIAYAALFAAVVYEKGQLTSNVIDLTINFPMKLTFQI